MASPVKRGAGGRARAVAPLQIDVQEPATNGEGELDTKFRTYIQLACAEYAALSQRCSALERATGNGNGGLSSEEEGEPPSPVAAVPTWHSERSPCPPRSPVSPPPGLGERAQEEGTGSDDLDMLGSVVVQHDSLRSRSIGRSGTYTSGASERPAAQQLRDVFRDKGEAEENRSFLKCWQNPRRGSHSFEGDMDLPPLNHHAQKRRGPSASWVSALTKANKWVVHPGSRTNFVFGVTSVAFYLYEVVMVPVSVAWNTQGTQLTLGIASVALMFWLLDMVYCCFAGYWDDDGVVLDANVISRKYFRSFFVLDLSVNCIDAVTLFLEFSQQSGRHRGALVRLLRMNRLVRVFAVVKHNGATIEQMFSSLGFRALATRFVAIILLSNHVLCCVFFLIGNSSVTDTGVNWLDLHVSNGLCYYDAEPAFQYLTSLHFMMSQMTPGSMAVVPQNSYERAFTVVCLFIGLFVSALFVAYLSSRLVQVSAMNQEQLQQASRLTRFLYENNVTRVLRSQIETQYRVRQRRKNPLTAKDVPALNILSMTLRQELARDMFHRPIITHTVFFAWDLKEPDAVSRMCSALELQYFDAEDDIFVPLVMAQKTYRLQMGQLEYKRTIFDEECNVEGALRMMHMQADPAAAPAAIQCDLTVGSWISTVALWLNWNYRGTLKASTASKVMTICVQDLCGVIRHYRDLFLIARSYAVAFSSLVLHDRYVEHYADVDVEIGRVLMNLPLYVRLQIMQPLMDYLIDRPTATKALLSLARAPAHLQNHALLEEEVCSGKCLLSVGPDGGICRTVFLVLLRLERSDGRILVRIAKLEPLGQLEPAVGLPAVKLSDGETPCEAVVHNIINKKLSSIAGAVVLGQETQTTETCDSQRYGICTTYKKHVWHGELFSQGTSPRESPPTPREPARIRRPSVTSTSCPQGVPHGWFATSVDLHAWLLPTEFEQLREASEEEVLLWLRVHDAHTQAVNGKLADQARTRKNQVENDEEELRARV